MFGGTEELLLATSPHYRGTLDANGRPTASALTTLAEAVASDKALSDNPTSFHIEIGAKKMTDAPQQGGVQTSMAKMSAGVEGVREGFGMQGSFQVGKKM